MIPVRFLVRGAPLPELPDPFPMAAVPRTGETVHLGQRYRVTEVCWESSAGPTVHLAPIAATEVEP